MGGEEALCSPERVGALLDIEGMGRWVRVGVVFVASVVGAALAPATPTPAAPTSSTLTGRVSVLPGSVEPSVMGDATNAVVSGSGRYVTFTTTARLSPVDALDFEDVYVRDLLTDEVELVSVTPTGGWSPGPHIAGAISANGRYVVFVSLASNLVASDTNGAWDVFIRDRVTDVTERVSVSSAGQQSTLHTPPSPGSSGMVDVSDDGRYVAFMADGAVFGAPATDTKAMVRDRTNGTTENVSISDTEQPGNADAYALSMSSDGRYVAFRSAAWNLITEDLNTNTTDIFRRDRQAGTTIVASRSSSGAHGFGSSTDPSISDDGDRIAFVSQSVLAPGDQATVADVFVRTVSSGSTTKISWDLGSGEADHPAADPVISGDGTVVAWHSLSGEYIAGGGNGKTHVFRRVVGTPITRQSVSSVGGLGNGDSDGATLSRDGAVLVFDSLSSNLVSGDTGSRDVFVRRNPEVGPHGSGAAFSIAVRDHFGATAATGSAVATRIGRGSSPEREILVLATAPAWAARRGPLARLYIAYFKRLPDAAGIDYWLGRMDGGLGLNAVSAQFAKSPEFRTLYGNTSDTAFVTLVYQNVLGRNPDADGLAYWVDRIERGMTRGTVMTSFSESPEGRVRFRPRVDTTLVSLGMLGAMPPSGLASAMVADMTGDSSALGISRLLRSSEYAAAV